MAKPDSKKKTPGNRNPDRRNGKAWKKTKGKPNHQKSKTPERAEKDFMIRYQRAVRRQEGMARHAEEKRLAEEKAAEEAALKAIIAAELKAQQEAELAEKRRHDPIGVAKRVKKSQPHRIPKQRKPKKSDTRVIFTDAQGYDYFD